MRNSILITGATGFIGSNLARRLVRDGFSVHVITRKTSNLALLDDLSGNYFNHVHDGTTEGLISIITDVQPDCIFHLAALFIAQHESKDVTSLIDSNIFFGTQLLEAMAVCGVGKIINTSTSWVHYGGNSYNPVNLYSAAKQAFNDIMVYYVEAKKIKSLTIELFDTYGPGDPRRKLFNLMKIAEYAPEPLDMSPGNQLIDLVYIDDVINAYLKAYDFISSEQSQGQHAFLVCTKKPISLRDFANLYQEITGKNLKIHWGGKPYREREVLEPYYSGQLLPGWFPGVELEQGIRMTLQIP